MSYDLDDEDGFLAQLTKVAPVEDTMKEEDFQGFHVRSKPIIEPFPQPVEYEKPALTKRLCSVDTETDPFLYNRVPEPFWVGFYDGEEYFEFWGDECVDYFFQHLSGYTEELVIYAHNGGKFDFHLFMDYLDDDTKPFLINGRIVMVHLGGQEFRDSYAILPVPLEKFNKKKIDYWKFERICREQYRDEICEYARFDVMSLFDTVQDFINRFGGGLPIAGTSFPFSKSSHGFNRMDKEQDARCRPFYQGGRVQCFEFGILHGPFVMVDRNSMYPAAMKEYLHPVGALFKQYKEIRDDTAFAYIRASSAGSLATGNGLTVDFTRTNSRYMATIHEIKAGLETHTLDIHEVIWSLSFQHMATMGDFVDYFYGLRQQATDNGDKAGREFYKLILNSAYGKFAMNTSGYMDWLVNPPRIPLPQQGSEYVFDQSEDGRYTCRVAPDGWSMAFTREGTTVWQKPKRDAGLQFINVATAASITGAARANLWRAICSCTRPVYCDTDSIICERASLDLGNRLGQWKIEAEGNAVLIAGKKMYAFLSKKEAPDSEKLCIDGTDFWVLKKAHKGVQLTGDQILAICRGASVIHENISPNFSFGGEPKFVRREVKMTGEGAKMFDIQTDLFDNH